MTTQKKVDLLKNANYVTTETKAVGGGEWSIEVYDHPTDEQDNKDLLFELVGSNGTRNDEEADDLHAELAELELLATDN